MREASDVRRVAAIGGVTAAAVVMLVLGKPVFFDTTAQKVPAAQATGDNSNGYYGSGKPTLVRYSRMP
jgi:hypothetical protein